MKRVILYSLTAAALALAATAPDDVTGEYTGFGQRPYEPGTYGCKVDINKTEEVYRVVWEFEDEFGYEGIGIIKDGYLCVGYAAHIGYGVALYKILPDGTLDGALGLPGFKEIGTEKLYRDETDGTGGNNQ
ncbi:MAG: hypothetical protein PVH29_09075 [Candidatus Zixiibacteriota bacterium]|jgi:hypothetical protein